MSKLLPVADQAILLWICRWICIRYSTYENPLAILSSTRYEKNAIPAKENESLRTPLLEKENKTDIHQLLDTALIIQFAFSWLLQFSHNYIFLSFWWNFRVFKEFRWLGAHVVKVSQVVVSFYKLTWRIPLFAESQAAEQKREEKSWEVCKND